MENELRAQSLALREKEFETAARERERALTDAREHVSAMMKMMESDRAQLRAKEVRISDLQTQVEDYRHQLATLIEQAVTRNRTMAERKSRPASRPKTPTKARRRAAPKKPGRRPKSKGRNTR
jgi:DNA repair ATPase RecN